MCLLKKCRLPSMHSSGTVVSSFLIQAITFGCVLSTSVYYAEFRKSFDNSPSTISLISSINFAVFLCSAPLSSHLVTRLPHRTVALIGAVLTTIAYIALPFTPNLPYIIAFYSCLSALGSNMTYIAACLLAGTVSKKHANFVQSVAKLGSGIGITLMPMVNIALIDLYSWKGSFYVVCGINLHLFPLALLLSKRLERDPGSKLESSEIPEERGNSNNEMHTVDTSCKEAERYTVNGKSVDKKKSTENETFQENLTAHDGDKVHANTFSENSIEDNPLSKSDSKVSTSYAELQLNARENGGFDDSCFECDVNKRLTHYNSPINRMENGSQGYQTGNLQNQKLEECRQNQVIKPDFISCGHIDTFKMDAFDNTDLNACAIGNIKKDVLHSTNITRNSSQNSKSADGDNMRSEIPNQTSVCINTAEKTTTILDETTEGKESKNIIAKPTSESLNAYDTNINSNTDEASFMVTRFICHSLRRLSHAIFLPNINFNIYVISTFFWNISDGGVRIFLADYAVTNDLGNESASRNLSMYGVGIVVGTVVNAIVGSVLNRFFVDIASLAAGGVVAILMIIPTFQTTAGLMCLSFLFGLMVGIIISLLYAMTSDLVKSRDVEEGYGIIILANGVGGLIGPPLFVAAFSRFGNYTTPMAVVSGLMFTGAAMITGMAWGRRRQKQESR